MVRGPDIALVLFENQMSHLRLKIPVNQRVSREIEFGVGGYQYPDPPSHGEYGPKYTAGVSRGGSRVDFGASLLIMRLQQKDWRPGHAPARNLPQRYYNFRSNVWGRTYRLWFDNHSLPAHEFSEY